MDLIRAKGGECVKDLIGRNERGDVKDRKIDKVVMDTGLQEKCTNFDIVYVAVFLFLLMVICVVS